MTEIIKNAVTALAELSFGWGAWVLFIFAVVGGVVVITKTINFFKAIFEKRKKKQSKQKNKGGK